MELPFDETSDFDVVFLSTRITQIEHKMLTEIHGWLQTENQTATIRKQEVIRRTIRMAYAHLQTQLVHMDEQAEEPTTQFVDNSPTNNTRGFLDVKAYQEMSNKTLYKPTAQNVHKTEKPSEILKGLGL